MRSIRNLTSALALASMASLSYASAPSGAAESMNGAVISSAVQQDQATPPKPNESKPKNETKDAKAPRSDKQQQVAPKEQEKQGQKGQSQAAGNHRRISDSDFKAHFGRSHSFTVRTVVTTTRIIPNQTQFAYGGYSFIFLEPWPAGWALTDDCYVDYIGGEYVLIDVAHPGMQLTLSIVG